MKLSSHKLKRGYSPELSLTSMIDVVFLLLIFFITTASFVLTERELHSAIRFPSKDSTVNEDLEPCVVRVEANTATGGAKYYVGRQELTSAEELLAFVTEHFRGAPGGAVVLVGKGVPFQWVAAAIHACEQADLGGVSYVPL